MLGTAFEELENSVGDFVSGSAYAISFPLARKAILEIQAFHEKYEISGDMEEEFFLKADASRTRHWMRALEAGLCEDWDQVLVCTRIKNDVGVTTPPSPRHRHPTRWPNVVGQMPLAQGLGPTAFGPRPKGLGANDRWPQVLGQRPLAPTFGPMALGPLPWARCLRPNA